MRVSAAETTLCAELELPYALICMIDNMANGVAKDKLSTEEFKAGEQRALSKRVQLNEIG